MQSLGEGSFWRLVTITCSSNISSEVWFDDSKTSIIPLPHPAPSAWTALPCGALGRLPVHSGKHWSKPGVSGQGVVVGSVLQKRRGVEDLAACIQTLHHLGVPHPALTALTVLSAGAVLAGALCNHNPQPLRAVILQAPFLDVLGTMQDPHIREHMDNIASYCVCYIIPQITAYSEDRSVPLSGVMKYVERLKKAIQMYTTRAGVNARVPAVILDLQPRGDHFGPEDLHLSLNETARQLAFLYTELGLDQPQTRLRHKEKVK